MKTRQKIVDLRFKTCFLKALKNPALCGQAGKNSWMSLFGASLCLERVANTVKYYMRIPHLTSVVFVLSMLYSGWLSAEYYRWEDKQGNPQYGDQVPAEDADAGRIKVRNGQIIEQIEAAKTPEEIKRHQEEQRISKIRQRAKARQAAYDRVLLATFNSVKEIEQVRDERISLIEQSINVSRERLHKQEIELVKLNEDRNEFIDRDLEPPEWIRENEKKVLAQISAIEDYINSRDQEKADLRKKLNKDIERYRELSRQRYGVSAQ